MKLSILIVCFLEKPAAAPAAKKAEVEGKLYFVSEPQSIKVMESKNPFQQIQRLRFASPLCLRLSFCHRQLETLSFLICIFLQRLLLRLLQKLVETQFQMLNGQRENGGNSTREVAL